MANKLTDRITQLESELQRCQQQVNYWTSAQLRTEGALLVLREIVKDEEANETSLPADTGASVATDGA